MAFTLSVNKVGSAASGLTVASGAFAAPPANQLMIAALRTPTLTTPSISSTVIGLNAGSATVVTFTPILSPTIVGVGALNYAQLFWAITNTSVVSISATWVGTAAGAAPGQAVLEYDQFAGFIGGPALDVTGSGSSSGNSSSFTVPASANPVATHELGLGFVALGNTSGAWTTGSTSTAYGNSLNGFTNYALSDGSSSSYANLGWADVSRVFTAPPQSNVDWTTNRAIGAFVASFYDTGEPPAAFAGSIHQRKLYFPGFQAKARRPDLITSTPPVPPSPVIPAVTQAKQVRGIRTQRSTQPEVQPILIYHVNHWEQEGGPFTISISPAQPGDCLVLLFNARSSTSGSITNVSGGGVVTSGGGQWGRVAGPLAASSGNFGPEDCWMGVVGPSGAGPQTVTVTFSGTFTGGTFAVEEFGSSLGINTQWSVVANGTTSSNSVVTTVPFPTLTTTTAEECYVGIAYTNIGTGGSSPGFTYIITGTAIRDIAYNNNLLADTSYSPTCTQDASGGVGYSTIAIILQAGLAPSFAFQLQQQARRKLAIAGIRRRSIEVVPSTPAPVPSKLVPRVTRARLLLAAGRKINLIQVVFPTPPTPPATGYPEIIFVDGHPALHVAGDWYTLI